MLKTLTPVITIILCLYLVADIFIPSFFGGKYFWFIKSFFQKNNPDNLEKELADAEKSFNDAFDTLKNITDKGTAEYEKAKASYDKAEELYKKAKDVFEKIKSETHKQ